jgi:integrase
VKQVCGQVFRYGVATGRVERDVTADLKGALSDVPEKHYPTITAPEEIGGLMRAIDGLNGSLGVRLALKLQAYTFVRPGELRKAEWKEIDLDKAEWRIPPARMKMKRLHIVPLSTQALDVLRELRLFTGEMKYLFPTFRSTERPMSDATVNAALRRLSYKQDVFTGHSFRSMASTILNEHQFNRDWIERQLAHVEGNSVRAAYNYADYLPERRKMMQWWADWLDEQAQV